MQNIQVQEANSALARIVRDSSGRYNIPRPGITEDDILELAAEIAASKINNNMKIDSPAAAKRAVQFYLGNPENEQFSVLWLDTQYVVIALETLFQGSVNSASVYPRVIVQAALRHNAVACILVHNHPSGFTEPSEADRVLTKSLKKTLELIDVRVLDHFIIGDDLLSFAEKGLI